MRLIMIAAAGLIATASCSGLLNLDQEKQNLLQADRAFSRESVTNGAPIAFDSYMADSATILRNNAHPFTGRERINELFANWPDGTLEWEPEFVDVSLSGDMGYTYGRWDYTATDSTGNEITSSGYYITIWKKQPDGSWKWVFDTGTEGIPQQ